MKRREHSLLENRYILAGIYIDPKAKPLLDESQIHLAKDAFVNLAVKVEASRNVEEPERRPVTETNSPPPTCSSFEERIHQVAEQRISALRDQDTHLRFFRRSVKESLDSLELFGPSEQFF